MERRHKLLQGVALITSFALILSSCAPKSEERRKQYAREFYTEGLKEYRKGDYGDAKSNFEKALSYLEQLTPEQIKKVKYLLVKSAFMDKDYVNAVVYAEDFLSNYPGSPEAEEVFYILVVSLVKVAPDPYRDQTYTMEALKKANEFLEKYPNSRFRRRVEEAIDEARRKLAHHYYYIAKFYEDYGYPYNAAVRYREVLINFPDYFSDERITYSYLKNLLLTPKQVEREKEKIEKLIEKAKESLEEVKSEEEREAIRNRIEFLKSEIKRWERIQEEALKEAEEGLKKFKETYGETPYYKELLKLRKRWKS